jgi:hypothetical protein
VASSPLETDVIAEVVAPVLQIMPELQEFCGEPSVVRPLEVSTLGALAVALAPSPPLSSEPRAFVDRGDLDAFATLSHVTSRPVVSLSDEVSEVDMIAPNFEDLFGKEICDFLVGLEAACPGYGKEIASVLTVKASDDITRKVEKSFRSKKRRGSSHGNFQLLKS